MENKTQMKKVVVEQSQQEMAVEAFGCGDKIYTFSLISHSAEQEYSVPRRR